MRLVVVAVFDAAVQAFMTPIFVQAKGQAIRSFGDAVADPQSPMSKHPTDYRLQFLGEWDDQTGEFLPGDGQPLANGGDFAARPPAQLREA